MKNFLLLGVAGYVAPRHLEAIKATGNNLVAAYDPSDSVGILDSYFPEAAFFTQFEIFERHVEKFLDTGQSIDFVSICSPNYLHDSHIRFGLRIGANVICEKPMVLNPWNVDAIQKFESKYPGKVNNILQLRLHDNIISLKKEIENYPEDKKHTIDLKYISARGQWYKYSWKGDSKKSGGIATNIGIHFFDMLIWIFGEVVEFEIHESAEDRLKGTLTLKKATVNWLLSINKSDLPEEALKNGSRTYRALKINDNAFSFSQGFEDLHILSYKNILKGEGFGIDEVRKVISFLSDIRNA